jgi:hypothetical protein
LVNDEKLSRRGVDREAVIGEFELSDDRMIEALSAGGFLVNLVASPEATKRLALEGYLPDELVQLWVVDVRTDG